MERIGQFFRHWVPFAKSCRHLQMLLGALLLATWANGVRAGDIVIVLSSDAAPYAQSETELKKTFNEQKRETRTLALQDVSTKGLEATVGKNADLVVAVGTPAAVWLHGNLPATTPLVYCMVSDPQGAGLTQGRATLGVSTDVPLTVQFGLLAEAFPKGRTVGLLYRANTPAGQRLLKNVQESLPNNWQLKSIAVDTHASIADAIEALMKQNVDVVWTTPDSTIYDTTAVRALLLASIRTNTPVFGFSPAFVKAGALLGIGIDPQAQGRQAANLGLRLLSPSGDPKPPAVNPTENHQIAVNLIVARQINRELPPDLVQRATHVFKESR